MSLTSGPFFFCGSFLCFFLRCVSKVEHSASSDVSLCSSLWCEACTSLLFLPSPSFPLLPLTEDASITFFSAPLQGPSFWAEPTEEETEQRKLWLPGGDWNKGWEKLFESLAPTSASLCTTGLLSCEAHEYLGECVSWKGVVTEWKGSKWPPAVNDIITHQQLSAGGSPSNSWVLLKGFSCSKPVVLWLWCLVRIGPWVSRMPGNKCVCDSQNLNQLNGKTKMKWKCPSGGLPSSDQHQERSGLWWAGGESPKAATL